MSEPTPDAKADLHRYLKEARAALLLKLDGLSEYDVRRPLTPTGTNLLGLVKHCGAVESGHFGFCFGRPFPQDLPWTADDAEPNSDMWATAEESREEMLDLYRRICAHADETIESLPLDAVGRVPWWTNPEPTLHRLLVHTVAEVHRHAGHADIVREQIDGAVGLRRPGDNLPEQDAAWWAAYREKLEAAAREAAGSAAPRN